MASQLALTLPQQPSLRVLLPDPEAQQQAATRLGILQMIFDYKNDPTRFGSLKLKDGKKVKSYSRMVEYASEASYASETGGVTVRTLYRLSLIHILDCNRSLVHLRSHRIEVNLCVRTLPD